MADYVQPEVEAPPPPADAPARRKGKASKKEKLEEVQSVVRRSIDHAIDYYEEHLAPLQKEGTEYYNGDELGTEEDGRSKVVMTIVRDAVLGVLPSLMRIFFGPDRPVEYRPDKPETEAVAEEMTNYVHYLVAEENPGFLIFYAAFKDALVRKLGWLKWWKEDFYRIEGREYTGLSQEAYQILVDDESTIDVRITGVNTDVASGQELLDAYVTRKYTKGCITFAAVPPEEVAYSPSGRSLDKCPLVVHHREVPRDYLVQRGIKASIIDAQIQKKRKLDGEDLASARRLDRGDVDQKGESVLDESQLPVLFAEAYALVDVDGDGIAELRVFECVGPDWVITNRDSAGLPGRIIDRLPLAYLTPDPEPHTIPGLSYHDLLRDQQLVVSDIWRRTLDSLAEATEPSMLVDPDKVNMADALKTGRSRVVRAKDPINSAREFKTTFVGGDTLPMIDKCGEVVENRTGHSKASAGLDADSLQSSTKAAVAATLSASQQRAELIARVFAETGVKALFKGLLSLVCRHQDPGRMVRINRQWVKIDPRDWDANADVTVNVAIGQGMPEDRIQAAIEAIGFQKEALQNGVPFVNFVHLRAGLAEALSMAGIRNVDKWFAKWGPEEQQAYEQKMAQQPPQPDPAMMLAQAEVQKLQLEGQIKQAQAKSDLQQAQAKLQMEMQKMMLENDRERDKMAQEMVLKIKELELKFAADLQEAQINAEIQARRAEMDAEIQAHQVQHEAHVAHRQVDADLEARKYEADQQPAPEGGEA